MLELIDTVNGHVLHISLVVNMVYDYSDTLRCFWALHFVNRFTLASLMKHKSMHTKHTHLKTYRIIVAKHKAKLVFDISNNNDNVLP